MKKKVLLLTLTTLLSTALLHAQTTLYARANSTWNNNHPSNGTWSTLGPNGPSCNCIPTDDDSVIIDGYNVLMSNNGSTQHLTITAGSALTISNNSTLSIHNSGNLLLQSGGSIIHSGAGSNARFQYMAGNYTITVEDGFNFSVDDILIEDNVSLTFLGAGNITLTNDISFEGNNSIAANNTSGAITVNRDIWFEPGFSNNQFINNGFLIINDDISLNGTNNGVVNNDTIILNDDVSLLGSFCFINNNISGIIECDDDISFDGTTDCKVTNAGNFLVRGQGIGGIVFEGLRDSIVNTGILTTDLDLKVRASQFDNNVFINEVDAVLNVSGEFDLNDADFVFDNSGTFNLTGRMDEMAGNEVFFNRSGAVVNYFGSHNDNLNGELALFANFDANEFNYLGSANQDVIVPQDAYWHLNLGGDNIKELQGNIDVKGDVIINGTASLAVSSNNFNITIAGNWQNTSSFIAGNGTVTFNGVLDQSIQASGGETFHNLNIQKSTGKAILSSDVDVLNVLSLTNGPCDLNSNTLTVLSQNTTAITRTSGFIISEKTDNSSQLVRNIGANTGLYLFPFGTTNGVYIPFTLQATGGNLGRVTLATYSTGANNLPWPSTPDMVTNLNSVIGASPDNRDNTIDRFWQINKTGSTGIANLSFSYAQTEVTGNVINNENLLQAQRYNTATNNWESAIPVQSANAANNTVTVNGVNSFSPWTLAISSAPLPITLLSFDAVLVDNNVELTWITSAQLNNDYFTLEKSTDAETFTPFAQIDGAGTNNAELAYMEVDFDVNNGTTYYRLKQTDFNGEYTYSDVVNVTKHSSQFEFNVYPNPTTSNNVNVNLQSGDSSVNIIITDMTGSIVYNNTIQPLEGKQVYTIEPNHHLPPGSYIMNGVSSDYRYTSTFVITD